MLHVYRSTRICRDVYARTMRTAIWRFVAISSSIIEAPGAYPGFESVQCTFGESCASVDVPKIEKRAPVVRDDELVFASGQSAIE